MGRRVGRAGRGRGPAGSGGAGAGYSRSSYTSHRARAPHPARSWDRRRPPRDPPPRTPWPSASTSLTSTCTAGWTVDAGAARVSPALSGAVGRGNARVSGLGRGAGLVHQLQTVGDCVGSGCGGCAGVRSSLGTCEGRKKGHGSVQHPADREPGTRGWRARATRSDARGRARRDRYIAEVVPATAFRAWARRSRAPTPGAAPCRSETHRSFSLSRRRLARTWWLPSIVLPTARDALSGQSRRAQTASGLYPRRGPLLDRRRRLWLGGGRFRAIRR